MDERWYAGSGFLVGVVLTLLVYGYVIVVVPEHIKHGRFASIKQNDVRNLIRAENVTLPRGPKAARILCWIITQPMSYLNKTITVKETWARDCDVTLFFSSTNNTDIPTINLGIPDQRTLLAKKTFAALQYIYKHYFHKADWFLKADDDTYVIVNNLRHFLSDKDPDAKVYYGNTFNTSGFLYQSGGAGYVMGRRVLGILAKRFWTPACDDHGPEDMRIGECLQSLGVAVAKSADKLGNTVFHWADPDALTNRIPAWAISKLPYWFAKSSISKQAISFHYIHPKYMKLINFLLKNLTVYGYQKAKSDIIS